MKKFIGLSNIKYYLYRSLIYIGLIIIFVSLFIGYDESINRILELLFLGCLWLTAVSILPLLLLFFNYSKENKNSSLVVDNGLFEFSKNKQQTKFISSNIDEVEVNISMTLFYNKQTFFLWDEYYYYVIKLKDGRNITITCLLCNDLENYIPSELFKKKKRAFATTYTF